MEPPAVSGRILGGADTLNSLYFGIGVSIILALLVALVGPLLVDWTAYRAAFEARATEILGHPVRVTGTADATFLPVPELAFTGVVIGADPDNPLMTVGRFDVEVELFPLLSGEVRVTRMQLEQPEVTLRVKADGAVDWIAEGSRVPVDPQKVVFDRVDVTDGRVRILDERRPAPIEITGINAAVEARTLLGPYKFDGGMVVDGEPVLMRLSTGAREPDGRIVVKASVTPASRPVEITFDGALSVTDRQPEWSGSARVRRIVAEGETALPWMLAADMDVDPGRIRARQLEFRYGPEDRPFAISGAATVDLAGEPTFDAVLSARQIDLDRTLGEGPDKPVSFETALGALASTLQDIPKPPIEGRIGFDIPGIVVGGSLIQSLRLDLATAPDGWRIETLHAGLPGRTTLAAEGALVTRPATSFEGTVSLASEQPATLIAWWYPTRERTALDPFDVRAGVQASAAGMKLSDLAASLGPAAIQGEIAYVPQRSGRNASLDLSLGADRVGLDQMSAVAGLFTADATAPTETDVALRFSADQVTAGATTADGVDIDASLVAGTLDVQRFYVRDLAGARISAEGTVADVATAPDGSLQARVGAERLDGLAELVSTLAPGSALAEMLRTAAPVLVPASVEATVTAARVGEGTNATMALKGTAGGSSLDTTLAFAGRVDRWRNASIDLAVDVSGPNGVRLMRQLGFEVRDVPDAGIGSLMGSLHGVPAEGLEVSLDGALGGTRVGLSGTAQAAPDQPASADVDVDLASDDVGPILALGGDLMASLIGHTPVDLSAHARVEGPRAAFTDLIGTVDGERVSGDLVLDTAPAVPSLRGSLALKSADLESLLELALGAGTTAMPIVESRSPWPEAPFGPTVLDGIDADIALAIDEVTIDGGPLKLAGFSTDLRSSAAGIGFDAINAGFAGGKIGGSLIVKRDLEGQAAINGNFALDGAAADTLAWRRNDRPVVTGALGFDVDFTATGRTVAGLVSTMAGGGILRVTDGELRSMNPHAFSAVIRAADAGQDMPEDRIRALFRDNVDVGDLPFTRLEGAFTIASGVLRAPSLVVTTSATSPTTGSATVDLSHQSLESDWTLALADSDGGAGTAPPQVDILFRGDISDPDRRIDVTALSSYLSIRAFEKETERVLVLQADILERELLSRSVLRSREADERRLRAEEAARRRAEDEAAARRAIEEAAANGTPAPVDGGAGPAPDDGDFTTTIGQKLDELLPQEPPPVPAPSRSATPPTTVERIPLPPPAAGDPSLPGVRIPAPL